MGAVTGRPLFLASLLLVSLLTTSAQAGSILGEEWEKFLTERVSFSGFVENTAGLAVSNGDRHFSTSNRYCYARKLLHVDDTTWEAFLTQMWDRKGEYWKELYAFRTPVKLPDGRRIWSVGTALVVNVQNGRSTVLTTTRVYPRASLP